MPYALVAAAALVLAAAGAIVVAVIAVGRGPEFSTAGSVRGGYVALVGPAVLCLVAGVARIAAHPERVRAGVLVVAAGVAWPVGEWDNPDAGSALIFSAGLACFAVAPAVVLHVALGGVRGRLEGWPIRLLVAAGYAVTLGLAGVLSAAAYDPASSGCPSCPDNWWSVGGVTGSSSLSELGVRCGLAWSALATAMVLAMIVRASPARRASEGPRWLPAMAFLGLTVMSYAHSLDRGFLGADLLDRRLWVAQGLALAALAVGVLAELARGRAAERALARVVVDLSGAEVSLGAALAVRLGDPELVLAFPVDHGSGFVDSLGEPVDASPADGRVVTTLSYGGAVLATLVHRRGVLGSKDAVNDLVATIHLGLEHERLGAEALAQVDALRASGVRLVETGDDERRRLERDLHDGAQQRLVGLALGLRLMQTKAGPSPALSEAVDELNRAIDDLRSIARGLAPVLLTQAGLGPALRGLAESGHLRLGAVPVGRFSTIVESTVYALVEKATSSGPVNVDIRDDGASICVEIASDRGLPDLLDLGDRVTALGGEVQVAGSTLRVLLPTGSRGPTGRAVR
jgi:signal transduction histidine kinase